MKNTEKKVGILWFRNDLRLHDNEALEDALNQVEDLYPVYVLDDRWVKGKTSYGFPKTGHHRMKFILESLTDLKKNLQARGSDLYVYTGKTEDIIFDLVSQTGANWVFCNRERTQEESEIQDALEKKLWTIGREMRFYRGKMLLYTADLPFPVTHTPDTFTQFRKEVEKFVLVRKPLDTPEKINGGSELEPTSIPDLEELGFSSASHQYEDAYPFKGGETEAINRLKYYLWESDCIAKYKETRNGLLGEDYSSKFSAYLSQGCLSPKLIYSEVKKYEKERQKNQSTYWLIFELLWRDYFRFIAKKYGTAIFQFSGINGHEQIVRGGQEEFEAWCEGQTGIPFIDANMRELNATGFMSNRGRQNVASFLIHDLKVNWLWGAEYMESLLVDYDPCSNYGNWNYLAGVGTDPREGRYFKVLNQAKRYDPNGDYIRHWIPELAHLDSSDIHWPFDNPSLDDLPDIYKNPVVLTEVPV